MQQISGVVGPGYFSDGSAPAPRIARSGELVMTQAHARYQEAVMRGNVFCAGLTSVATWGTALTATMVTLALINPAGSGKNLVVWKGAASVVTSTTAGSLVWAGNIVSQQAAVTFGTKLTPANCLLGSQVVPVGIAASACTLPAAPTMLRPFAFGPVTATAGTGNILDIVDGEFILQPNSAITIQGITIVGTGLLGISWEEVVA